MNARTAGTVERELHFYRKSTKHEKCFICDICERWIDATSRFLRLKTNEKLRLALLNLKQKSSAYSSTPPVFCFKFA